MKYRQSPYKTLLLLSILVLYLGSCSNDEILLPDVKPIQGTTPTPDPNPDPVMSMMIPLEELRNELTEDILNFNNLNGGEKVRTEGFIISNDNARNIQNALYIQDKSNNPILGVRILINRNNINNSSFGLNRKVTLELNGLGMQYNDGVLEIGKLRNNGVISLESNDFATFIIATTEAEEVTPVLLTVKEIQDALASPEITDNQTGILISIEDVQFIDDDLGKTYADERNTNEVVRTLRSCSDGTFISLINGGNALFKNDEMSQQKGTITAILEGSSLRIRDVDDISFNADLCRQDVTNLESNVTLDQVVALYQGGLTGFDSTTLGLPANVEPILEGYIIRVDTKKNRIYIQDKLIDPTTGIAITIRAPQPSEYNIGQRILVQLKNIVIDTDDNDVLQLGKLDKELFILSEIENNKGFIQLVVPTDDPVVLPTPKIVSVDDILDESVPQSIYVQLNNMQLEANEIKVPTLEEDKFKRLYSCDTNTIIQIQKGYFSAALPVDFNTKNGTITGVTSFMAQSPTNDIATAFLILNESSDAKFTEDLCIQP